MSDFILNPLTVSVPHSQWQNDLKSKLNELLIADRLEFKTLIPRKITQEGGVYIITDSRNPGNEIPYYIGRTKNLRRRIYTNHLMGPLTNARLKKYLVNDPVQERILDKNSAKEFIRENCSVRWIVEQDYKFRGYYEGYFTGVLKPQYGVYEEH